MSENENSESYHGIVLSAEDKHLLTDIYDLNKKGGLSDDDIESLVAAYNFKQIFNPQVLEIMKRYDINQTGFIGTQELENFKHHYSLGETYARYAGYTAGFARRFKYLAHSSDVGEALSPVVSERIVKFSYAISLVYVLADISNETFKLRERGFTKENSKQHMSTTQCITERVVFQVVASVIVPTFILHHTIELSRKVCVKINRFKRWGPTLAALAVVPLLPLCLDEPIERGVEHCLRRFGPWRTTEGIGEL